MGVGGGGAPTGDCLQHSNFTNRNFTGETMDDKQTSLARISAERAYCPHYGEKLAGCALRTRQDVLFAGSAIGTWSGRATLSPLGVALSSLGDHGGSLEDIASVVWAGESQTPEVERLQQDDQALLQSLAPDVSFAVAPKV